MFYPDQPVSPIPFREPLTDVYEVWVLHGEGIVSCWGDNHYSQLGNGSQESSDKPVRVAF